MITYDRFIHSDYATSHSIDNTPPVAVKESIEKFIETVVRPLENMFGTIAINSGYRCLELNSAIRGVPTSDHCKGCAIDFIVPGKSIDDVFWLVRHSDLEWKQLILERNGCGSRWVHISYDFNVEKQKNQVLELEQK